MPAIDPVERRLIATVGAHAKWANTSDRSAATANARKAFGDRFERQVDPDGVLPPAERAKRAENARKAYYTLLALKSVQARKARARAAQLEAEIADALDGGDAA